MDAISSSVECLNAQFVLRCQISTGVELLKWAPFSFDF
jgi:hypothetical protein